MFVMYRGFGATLVRALVQLALDRNADAFEEIRPPTLVKTETMISTGHLPKFVDDAYHLERDDLWAIPTAEVPLTSLARDEILDEAQLADAADGAHVVLPPRGGLGRARHARSAACARVRQGRDPGLHHARASGRDARRDPCAVPSRSIRDLGLAYRIVDLCAGDIGSVSSRTWDIEVYAPGVDRWLECSSVSWFGDYQARRANIRYRPAGQKGTQVIHTLNGSALAVPRVWAALVETYRQPDGSVAIPPLLQPYMRGRTSIPAR